MAQKFLSGCSGVECVCVCGENEPEMGSLAAGGLEQQKEHSSPPAFYPLLSLSSPLAPFFPCPPAMANRVLGAELETAGKELGRASRPGSTGGQTEAQRAEGPCPEPHSSQDHTGVKGHLGAQSGSSFHQWRRPSIKASRPPRTNESVCVSTAS